MTSEYTMRVCIFRVRCTLLAGISIVYLNLGKFLDEYTMRVCIDVGVVFVNIIAYLCIINR